MKRKYLTINVMGTIYTVYEDSKNNDDLLNKNDGYVNPEHREIVLDESCSMTHKEKILTHELVHAFLYESGLDVESWATNEEIVDWIALQLPKLSATVKDSLNKYEIKTFVRKE